MRIVFSTLLWVILILLAVAVAIFLLSLGFVGMGWLLSRILPLSLFEASVIALLSGLGLAYVISQITSTMPPYEEDWEDEEDWDEEDWGEEWEV
jgi:predicted RND superfamily exporter protein